MKMMMILLLLSLTKLAFSKEGDIKNFYSIKNIVDKISRETLENGLREFVLQTRPSRVFGSVGHKKAQDYIESVLKEIKSPGTSVYANDFTPDVVASGKMYEDDFNKEIVAKLPPSDPNYKRWKDFTVSMLNGLTSIKGIPGKNYIWEKKGSVSPNEVIIIGANYDTLNHDPKTMKVDLKSNMPGADNNGTGTTMLLQMAKVFNMVNSPKTIRLVFFDAEEFGFLGSKAFVELISKNPNEKVLGFVNLVMLGNDTKLKDTDKKLNNMKVYLRDPNVNKEDADKDLAFVDQLTKSGKSMYPMIDFIPTANGMNSSSHIRFWEAKIPALCFTQNWETDFNPRFHTPDDFVETVNMNTYVNGFRYIVSSLLAFDFGMVK